LRWVHRCKEKEELVAALAESERVGSRKGFGVEAHAELGLLVLQTHEPDESVSVEAIESESNEKAGESPQLDSRLTWR